MIDNAVAEQVAMVKAGEATMPVWSMQGRYCQILLASDGTTLASVTARGEWLEGLRMYMYAGASVHIPGLPGLSYMSMTYAREVAESLLGLPECRVEG